MHPIVRTVLQRLGSGSLTLFVVSIVIFSSLEMLPGGFRQGDPRPGATPETVAAFNSEIGLDRPAGRALRRMDRQRAAGRFRHVLCRPPAASSSASVSDMIAPRLYNTFFLAVMAAIIAVPLALVLGVLAALYRNSLFDRIVNSVTLTTIPLPEFFVAYILMFFFAIKLPLVLSRSRRSSESTTFLEHIYARRLAGHHADPGHRRPHDAHDPRRASSICWPAPISRWRSSRAFRRGAVILHHALPNAWAPIVTVIAFNLAYLVVGVVVVEVVFVYPGIGQMMVDAVSSRDMPVVQACALIFAATYILLNLSADIVSIVTNPRLLHPKMTVRTTPISAPSRPAAAGLENAWRAAEDGAAQRLVRHDRHRRLCSSARSSRRWIAPYGEAEIVGNAYQPCERRVLARHRPDRPRHASRA